MNVVLLAHAVGVLPDALRALGATPVHVDPRDVPWTVGFSQRDRGAAHTAWLDVGGVAVSLDAVWIADLDVAAHLPPGLPPDLLAAAVGESRAAFTGVLDALPGVVINRPAAAVRAAGPLTQAAAIAAAGLTTARWFVGHDPEARAAFTATARFGVEAPAGHLGPLRAAAGPGRRIEVVIVDDRALGAPPALAAPLADAARRLGLRQARAELHLGDDGALTVLSLRPVAPDPADADVAAALAAALTRRP